MQLTCGYLCKANLTGRFLILVERYTGGPKNGPKASARSIPSATGWARASPSRQRVVEEANSSLYGFLDALPAVHCGKP